MDKKYLISIIIIVILLIIVIISIAGMNLGDFNKQTNSTINTTNNTTNNDSINVTHLENNTDSKSSNSNGDSSRYREVRDQEYLGDEVVYEDTATGKYYYHGQKMNYEKLADDYNREHHVGPYS